MKNLFSTLLFVREKPVSKESSAEEQRSDSSTAVKAGKERDSMSKAFWYFNVDLKSEQDERGRHSPGNQKRSYKGFKHSFESHH